MFFYGVMLGILILQKNIQKNLLSILLIIKKFIQEDKELISDLDFDGIEFPVQKKDFSKIGKKNKFPLMCLVIKMSWFFQFTFQIKNLKSQWICCF